MLLCVARRTALRQMSMRRLASLQNVSPHLHYKNRKKKKKKPQHKLCITNIQTRAPLQHIAWEPKLENLLLLFYYYYYDCVFFFFLGNTRRRKKIFDRASRTFMRASPSSVLVRAISELRQWSEQRCEDPVITSEHPTM